LKLTSSSKKPQHTLSTTQPDIEIIDNVFITFPSITNGDSIDSLNSSEQQRKRGRKRKTFIHKKFNDSNYVVLWEEICYGERVLIDSSSNVFTYDEKHPKYLGKYTLDGKIDNTIPYSEINFSNYHDISIISKYKQ